MKSTRKPISFLTLLVISSVFLTACESSKFQLGPKLGIKIPIEEMPVTEQTRPTDEPVETAEPLMFSQLDNSESEKAEYITVESQEFIGSGQFISKKSKKSKPLLNVKSDHMLNFDAADIGEVVKLILSEILKINYVISPKVSGTVTLQTTQPLHKEELLSTLEMLLRINNAVLIKADGLFRIEPDSRALQAANTSLQNRKIPTGYQIKVIPLKYVGVADMVEIIKPVVPNNAIIRADPARNLLLVAGTRRELEKILDLVNTFDVDFFAGLSFGLYPLENTEVDNTITEIEKIFPTGEKSPIAGLLRFISIKHLNAILVVSQQKAYLKTIKKWINRLDVQNAVNGEGGIVVYRVQHVDAVELASTLNEIISGVASTRQSAPSVAPGQRIARITNRSKTQKKKTVKTRKSSGTGNISLEGVNIIADEPNNALVILAEPQQYRILIKIIKQLDVMPLQVLIDATIVSVDLTDNLQYGVQWIFENSLPGNFEGAGALGTITTALEAVASGSFGYSAISSSDGVSVLLTALADDTKINVLSAPSLMVLNNHEANIKVGNSLPFNTGSTTSSGGTVTNNIEQLDTGVILTVKPRVNANGVVILEIEQKVDNALPLGEGDDPTITPTILQRQIKTTVAVISGESIVLGGLMSESHTITNTGIPLLKDIPYIGWLFGRQGKTLAKSELIVIITPRVVENKFDARKVTNEFKRKLSGIYFDREDYHPSGNEILRNYQGNEINSYQ